MSRFDGDDNYFGQQDTSGTRARRIHPVRDTTTSGLADFGKIFLYMFMYLAITTAVAFGVGYAISASFAASGGTDETIPALYLALLIGSAIGMFILMFVIQFIVIRGRHSVLVPSIIYAILVGVLFSCLTIFVDWRIMGLAFGITAGIFLLMGLIAIFTRGNMAPLAMMGIGLIIGGGLLALVNFFLGSTTLYWIVSFVIFAAIMFIAMYDIWRIRKITENGGADNNISYYCAFIMYTDFINIFVRILFYLLMIFGNRK